MRENYITRALTDQEVLGNIHFLSIYDGDGMAGLTGHIDPASVWTDANTFRLNASVKGTELFTFFKIETCCSGRVLIGGPQLGTVRTNTQPFRIGANIKGLDYVVACHIDGDDPIVTGLDLRMKVAYGHIDSATIRTDGHATRPDAIAGFRYMNGIDDLVGSRVDDGD